MFVDRRSPEYLKLVEQRWLCNIYGREDYDAMTWAEKTLLRLESRPWHVGFDTHDRAEFVKVLEIIGRVCEKELHRGKAGFDRNQPRHPAGAPGGTGGEWSGGGGTGGGIGVPPCS